MFRLLVIPLIIGAMTFIGTWLISPLILSGPGVVAIVADAVVNLSNAGFETMPPVVASYIASLNLALAALTVGFLVTVVIQLLVIIWAIFTVTGKWIIGCLHKRDKDDEPRNLPPLEMDSSFKPSKIGKGVMGRGLDSIDQN